MRKQLALGLAAAFLLFALAAVAQTSGSYGQNTPSQDSQSTTTTTTQSDTTQQDQSGSMSGSSQPGSWGTQTSSSNAASSSSLEGCVVRQQTDFFLIPQSGNPVHLTDSGSANLGSHVGHHVRVQGSQSMAGLTSPGTSDTTGGATGTASGTTGGSSTSDTTGSTIGANSGSNSGGSNDMHSAATQDMQVSRVDMISESCPANWNSRWNSSR